MQDPGQFNICTLEALHKSTYRTIYNQAREQTLSSGGDIRTVCACGHIVFRYAVTVKGQYDEHILITTLAESKVNGCNDAISCEYERTMRMVSLLVTCCINLHQIIYIQLVLNN